MEREGQQNGKAGYCTELFQNGKCTLDSAHTSIKDEFPKETIK